MNTAEIDEIVERSKDDRAIIVGSEIRGAIAALRAEIQQEREARAKLQGDFDDRDIRLDVMTHKRNEQAARVEALESQLAAARRLIQGFAELSDVDDEPMIFQLTNWDHSEVYKTLAKVIEESRNALAALGDGTMGGGSK